MKKTSFACLALAVPFLALTACTAVNNLALSANWYSRTNSTINANTREELRYLVLFESSDGNNFLSYGEGSYTTVLSAENTVLAGGENETCYHLTSTLNIPVTYTVNGETETFKDVVTSEVWFRDIRYSLAPVKSIKTVLSHSPVTVTPETTEDAYETYDYTYTTTYNSDCTGATVQIDNRINDKSDTYEIALSGSGTYFDNEQILFALRAVNPSSGITFRSVNPVTRQQATVALTDAATSASTTLNFSLNGAETAEHEIPAYTFSLSYSGGNGGLSQSYTYAALSDSNNNTYRNVLLRMDVPILHSLGTLRYTLSSAQFSEV